MTDLAASLSSAVGIYGSALFVVFASTLVGHVLCGSNSKQRWVWHAPAIGFAALIAICALGVELPGRATAAAALFVVTLAGTFIWLTRAGWPPWPRQAFILGALALAATAVPFLVNRRVGLIGVGLKDDTSAHLLWIEALRSQRAARLYQIWASYPIGPHAFTATLGRAFGVPSDTALMGVLVAVPVMTAMTAVSFLTNLTSVAATLGALLTALGYLSVSSYGQADFKETIFGLFLLGFVALLRTVARRPRREWTLFAVSSGLLVGGTILTYGHYAIAWYTAVVVVCAALALPTYRPNAHALRSDVGPTLRAATIVVLVVCVVVASQAGRIIALFHRAAGPAQWQPKTSFGNLRGQVPGWEVLGIWPNPDFRFTPQQLSRAGLAAVVSIGTIAACVAFASWIRHRDIALPGAVVAALIVYLVARQTTSPYLSAKALVIVAPLIGALVSHVILDLAWIRARPAALVPFRAGLGALFLAGAVLSSQLALRALPVASNQRQELLALAQRTHWSATLFLGRDDHTLWNLLNTPVGYLPLEGGPPSLLSVTARADIPFSGSTPQDFDSVTSQSLDRYRFVIAPRSDYFSEAPPNFRLVQTTRLFSLWERFGLTPSRRILEPLGVPGAVLNCVSAGGRALARLDGWASIWPTPVVVPGRPLDARERVVTLTLPLHPGTWSLAMQYTSDLALSVETGVHRWTMPAKLATPGSFFGFGTITATGDKPLSIRIAEERSWFPSSRSRTAAITAVAATAVVSPRVVPLNDACGSYVDWYRLAFDTP